MASEEYDVKREVAIANRILSNLGLATGVTADRGHASMHLPSDPGRFAVKGRQYAIDSLSSMRPEDMIICDTDGFLVDGPAGVVQCAEIKIHSCIYQLRPDVQSVVHVHPRFTVLLSTLGQGLAPLCQEGMMLVRDPLPVWPHVKIIQSHDEGMEVANLLGDGSAVLLFAHGAVTASWQPIGIGDGHGRVGRASQDDLPGPVCRRTGLFQDPRIPYPGGHRPASPVGVGPLQGRHLRGFKRPMTGCNPFIR